MDITDLKIMIHEKAIDGLITESERDELLQYVEEKEEDHERNMASKQNAARLLGKNVDELHNKKYDNPKKGKKADLKYEYKYSDSINNKKSNSRYFVNSNNYKHITKDSPKSSDIKLLNFMQKNSDPSDKEQVKKYRIAFNMFCNKYGIDPNSSFYIRYLQLGGANKSSNSPMTIIENRDSKKVTKDKITKDTDSKDNKFILPKGYCLIHRSNEEGLTELKPTKYSDKYSSKGGAGIGGQYHQTGRIYFFLYKENDILSPPNNYGKYMYKLISNIHDFYIDNELSGSKNIDKYSSIKNLIGRSVFVKTDKPLKVKQVK